MDYIFLRGWALHEKIEGPTGYQLYNSPSMVSAPTKIGGRSDKETAGGCVSILLTVSFRFLPQYFDAGYLLRAEINVNNSSQDAPFDTSKAPRSIGRSPHTLVRHASMVRIINVNSLDHHHAFKWVRTLIYVHFTTYGPKPHTTTPPHKLSLPSLNGSQLHPQFSDGTLT